MRRFWTLLFSLVPLPLAAQAVDGGPASNLRDDLYFTEREARDQIYGAGLVWADTIWSVDSAARRELHQRTGLSESDETVHLSYAANAQGEFAGAYRVASEVGKHRPFEFLVALDSLLRVRDIVVLTYRESRGGEVRRERFLRQYRGKDVTSPVRLNRDILGISGATLSAWAVNRGVKKTLWWAQRIWPDSGDGS